MFFSFNGNKIVTTGGGGVLISDAETAERAKQIDDSLLKVAHASCTVFTIEIGIQLSNAQPSIAVWVRSA